MSVCEILNRCKPAQHQHCSSQTGELFTQNFRLAIKATTTIINIEIIFNTDRNRIRNIVYFAAEFTARSAERHMAYMNECKNDSLFGTYEKYPEHNNNVIRYKIR